MSNKKRVLVFGMTSNYGGVESFIMNYYRHIDRSQVQFDFLVYNQAPAYSEEIKSMGGNIFVVPGRRNNYIKCRAKIKQILELGHYDAVWCNLCYMSDLLVMKQAKNQRVPIRIIHAHNSMNMSTQISGFFHKVNRKKIELYATDFWACSKAAGEYFYPSNIMDSDRFKTIPNAIDVGQFCFNNTIRERVRAELGISDQLVIGFVGRLHPQKNPFFLLDIFKEIHTANPHTVLVMVGDGELRPAVQSKIKELRLDENVMLLGQRNDITQLMQAMDIFVLPSIFEGLGIVLIEAQACGLPCYTSANVVPGEAKVTDLLHYVGLDKTASDWSKKILQNGTCQDRMKYNSVVLRSSYDICTQATSVSAFFAEDNEV